MTLNELGAYPDWLQAFVKEMMQAKDVGLHEIDDIVLANGNIDIKFKTDSAGDAWAEGDQEVRK